MSPSEPCEDETRAHDVRAGYSAVGGEDDSLGFTLVEMTPTPAVAGGVNQWSAVLEPVPETAPEVAGWMPDHGHGLAVPPSAELLADGTIVLSVEFSMPGYWELTLVTELGEVEIPICVGA